MENAPEQNGYNTEIQILARLLMTPRHITQALVKYVVIKYYLYDSPRGNMLNRRLHSGIITYVNNTPIIWYSKRHNTVEASSFGSESFAIRIVTDRI